MSAVQVPLCVAAAAKCLELASHRYVAAHQRTPLLTNAGPKGGIEAHTGGAPRRNLRAIKDPKRNGGKSMEQLVEHMAEDTFVGWGWAPGAEREPAPG
jgi:hypothetical protein